MDHRDHHETFSALDDQFQKHVASVPLSMIDQGDRLNTSSGVSDSSDPLPGLISDQLYWNILPAFLCILFIAGVLATGANVVNITIYSRLGFTDSTNVSLTALSVSDLFIAITMITTCLAYLLPRVPGATFTYEVFLTTSTFPHILFSRISAMITTYLSLERYLCVVLPLKIKTIITTKRTLVVMVIIYGVTFCLYPIVLVGYPMRWKFDSKRNRTLLGTHPSTDPTVVLINTIFLLILSTILPFLTFFLVACFTLLLSLSLRKSKAWRDANKFTPSNTESDSRPAAKLSKEGKAVRMVISIATVFIVANVPSCVQQVSVVIFPEYTLYGRYYKMFNICGLLNFGVDTINCGANVIIYYKMSRKFRRAFLGLFFSKAEEA